MDSTIPKIMVDGNEVEARVIEHADKSHFHRILSMSVVLLTNNSNRGQALAHLIQRAGLDLKLVVVEDASLRESNNGGLTQT